MSYFKNILIERRPDRYCTQGHIRVLDTVIELVDKITGNFVANFWTNDNNYQQAIPLLKEYDQLNEEINKINKQIDEIETKKLVIINSLRNHKF